MFWAECKQTVLHIKVT